MEMRFQMMDRWFQLLDRGMAGADHPAARRPQSTCPSERRFSTVAPVR